MLEWVFDLPLIVSGTTIILILWMFSLAGLLFVRRKLLPRWKVRCQDSEFIGAMVQAILVFYGLAVALIAVNVWEAHTEASRIVSNEATALGALFRDVSGYTSPTREKLQEELRNYTEQVIEKAWPLQRQGRIPEEGVRHMSRFQAVLVAHEPTMEGQKLLHAETLRAYNHMTLARRMRVDAVDTGLPTVLWIVIAAGAVISLSASFFFAVEDVRLHAVLVALLATFIGLVIFLILALDRPFRGELGVSSRPYQLILEQLMAH